MKRANVYTSEYEYDDGDPDGYRAAVARVGAAVGGESLVVKSYEIPGGQSLCPYHYEYEEEWLLVLEGSVAVRTPEGTDELGRGDIVQFPVGPEGAHKVTNQGEDTARILMFSSAREPSVAVYPDSDKIGVWPGREDDHVILRRSDGARDYWDGES